MKIGRVTISDRASAGVYADRGGPEIERVMRAQLDEQAVFVQAIVPDDKPVIESTLVRLADEEGCALILTTGGTGITPRDVTPEATMAVIEKELPGFSEAMRLGSFAKVRTSILSRAVAGTRGTSLIINLPGKPAAIAECLTILREAIKEALAHLRGEDPHLTERLNAKR